MGSSEAEDLCSDGCKRQRRCRAVRAAERPGCFSDPCLRAGVQHSICGPDAAVCESGQLLSDNRFQERHLHIEGISEKSCGNGWGNSN